MTVMTVFRGSEKPVKAVRVEIGRIRIPNPYTCHAHVRVRVHVHVHHFSDNIDNGKCGKFKGTAYLAWVPDTSPWKQRLLCTVQVQATGQSVNHRGRKLWTMGNHDRS